MCVSELSGLSYMKITRNHCHNQSFATHFKDRIKYKSPSQLILF